MNAIQKTLVRSALATLVAGALAATAAQAGHAAVAGSLDRDFADRGRQLTDFFQRNDRASAVATQGKGNIIVGGIVGKPRVDDRVGLVRYQPRGRVDRTFGRGGRAILKGCAASNGERIGLSVLDNGKILVAATCTADVVVARFLRNGKLDRSFGEGGKATTVFTGVARPMDIAVQPNGKIVVVGYTHHLGTDVRSLIVARYHPNGDPDASLDQDGSLTTRFGEDADVFGLGVAIQDDEKIVISGEVSNSWIVARLEVDGSPDASFGDNGVSHSGPIPAGEARDVAILPDGKILAAGCDRSTVGSRFGLVRYLPGDGSPDTDFGAGGAARAAFGGDPPSDCASALAVQSDGKTVVAGTARQSGPGDPRFALARFRPAGQLDTSFSRDGKVLTGFRHKPPGRQHYDRGEAVAIQPNGRILVAGVSQPFSKHDDFAVARYLGQARR